MRISSGTDIILSSRDRDREPVFLERLMSDIMSKVMAVFRDENIIHRDLLKVKECFFDRRLILRIKKREYLFL